MQNKFSAIPEELCQIDKMGIYGIVNELNNKIYIGSSIKFKERWKYHRTNLKANKHYNIYLQSAWNKNWGLNFKFIVIEYVDNKSFLIEREQFWIDALKPFGDKGYNLRPTANSNVGFKFSLESLQKLSKSKKGFKHTEEAKAKMRFSKPNMSERMKGNQYNKGRKYSEEDKIRLRNQPRKFDKWPHEKGYNCKCEECMDKKRKMYKSYRLKYKKVSFNAK